MRGGLTASFGGSTGRGIVDTCASQQNYGNPNPRDCNNTEDWLTTVRGLASYTIPKVDVLISATVRSTPPLQVTASWQVNTASTITPILGHPPAGSTATTTITLTDNEHKLYLGGRRTTLDMRFAKVLRFSGRRADIGVDLNNALNTNYPTSYNGTFIQGTDQPNVVRPSGFLTPTAIYNPRFGTAELHAELLSSSVSIKKGAGTRKGPAPFVLLLIRPSNRFAYRCRARVHALLTFLRHRRIPPVRQRSLFRIANPGLIRPQRPLRRIFMRHLARAALCAVVVLALPTLAGAQILGTVAGSARDASGAVLPGVNVEVSSPALIERVRTATTDGTGLYRIVNLPPGVYAVTFTLQGFNTVKREQVQVQAGFTATIDGEMKVGAVQETVTVTGLSPVIDVQSAAATRSVTADTFKEIPSSGSWLQMASLVPAIRASVQDVGGVLGDQTGAMVSAHGSRSEDGVSLLDGLRIGNMYQSSNLTNMSLSPLLFEQVDVQLSGQMGETGTNGVVMNAIPKAGGNQFRGTALVSGSSPSLQGDNVTDDLEARGLLGASTKLKKLYDINGALGGPVVQDKLWFFGTSRYFTNNFYVASRFYPVDVNAFRRVDDTSNQAYGGTYTYDNNGRLTWAINDKQKLTGWYAYQYKVDPFWQIQTFTQAPEASRITTWHTQLSTFKYTYVPPSKFLIEAGVAAGGSPDTIKVDLARGRRDRDPGNGRNGCVCADLSRADRLRLRRSPAIAVVQRLRQLRHRVPQREDRDGAAARPLLARRQQRFDGRPLVRDA